MSGGSYEYLYLEASAWIVDHPHYLVAMIEDLRKLGYEGTAGEISQILADFASIEARIKALRDVFHALEWYRSNDWGPEQVGGAVTRYRLRRPDGS